MGKYCWENPIFISGGSREMKIIKDKDLDWEKVNHPGSKVLKKVIIKNGDLLNITVFGKTIF